MENFFCTPRTTVIHTGLMKFGVHIPFTQSQRVLSSFVIKISGKVSALVFSCAPLNSRFLILRANGIT